MSEVAPALRVQDLCLSFAGVKTLQSVSFDVPTGALASLIGPNGAGKTSLVNCLTGYYRPDSGRIEALGRNLTGLRPDRVARAGIVRTYQNVGLFGGLSVADNLLAGRHLRMRSGLLAGGLSLPWCTREELAEREVVEDLLALLEIGHLRTVPAGRLPYGLQKRVELGRALAMEPALLLLDEPMAGMNLGEKRDMVRLIRGARDRGVTVLLIEHDMSVVMGVSDVVAVLDFGHLIAYGPPDQVSHDPAVVAAYLGVDDAEPVR
ncbi:ABC transporter ATP-binding protein [Jiangella anatolica]|uniref:ABC transporter ATP-binding protein n=1 Tax=Jiangella anatolica TaxID=2670374 RepID=A0A2W2BSC6_9ACTN|nr:ABC transporter ATP-binding protein [Jiangella anatolica]PZF83354.1 ABC transporter ATP-binding protein [Jiangella anatolica]